MTSHEPGLIFPDAPKLELDQLIDQLLQRAEDVKRAQGRLRTLLRAIGTVTGELALEAVLRNVVEAACTVSGAQYGALGVIGPDEDLEQFITVGIDPAEVAQIEHPPEGKGLLGTLIRDPRPIRLSNLAQDERSSGFPANHPSMTSFLGVPVRVRGEVFGNLYLTNSSNGNFSDEDEQLITALAAAAGTAISNARLYDESRLQQQWLAASVEIGAQLLADTGEDPLQLVARRAAEIADTDLVTIGLLTADDTEMVIETAIGSAADSVIARRFPLSTTLGGQVVAGGRPLLLRGGDAEVRASHLATAIDVGTVMVLPLVGGDAKKRGVLSLGRVRGRPAFSAGELNMAAGFANHASVALELTDARAAAQRVLLLEDRERIARDLHDHVIQELFAIGLSLESSAVLVGADTAIGAKLQQRVADIDRTIRQIRTSIFELRGPLAEPADGLRQSVLDVAADLAPALGFSPAVTFGGPVDALARPDLADDVLATIREALTNVAKHAGATSARVDIGVAPTELTVTVSDNGAGIRSSRRSGLANLRDRAVRNGGDLGVESGPAGGTTITWTVPVT